LPIGPNARGNANKKRPVAILQIMAGWDYIGHYLDACLLDFRSIRQRLHAARPAAYVQGDASKLLCRSLIETSHFAGAIDHDDRHIDRIKDARQVRT
jgi:hypothetical protein